MLTQSTPYLQIRKIADMMGEDENWFLRQWLATTGTTQAALSRRTGWDKRKTSFLVNGQQDYRREDLNEAAAALGLKPFELLMHPAEAAEMRAVRNSISLAAERRLEYKAAHPDDLPDWKHKAN